VLGHTADAPLLAERHGVRQALVAIPSLDPQALRRIVSGLNKARLKVRILPPLAELVASASVAPQLREVALEDLLRREPVPLDTAAIAGLVRGRSILVTGGAGSIGSELCRQVFALGPAILVGLDCAETPLHDLTLEFQGRAGSARFVPRLVDVTDPEAVRQVFEELSPEVVFHAAALKHVPVLEDHPQRAIQVNVGGTRVVAEAAAAASATFVMVSTDKAVRPSSVMGATKRIAEQIVRGLSERAGRGRFVSVRFGNVLGSNGSVVPIFRRQLAQGGPLTVTHPEMRRYFMTIPEAVHLVLQAGALGRGGEVFVLDMGEPVRIVDLAEDLIRLSGLEPGVDVKIEFTGVRPGEKLFEEWSMDSESLSRTAHAKVFELRSQTLVAPWREIHALELMASSGTGRRELLEAIRGLVPDYREGATAAGLEGDPEATPAEAAP
jgi:FlaA1/EpsC-like NDP-sugar epimerase